jgi:hypothetical protein
VDVGFYWELAHKEKQTARASETTVSIREKGFLLFFVKIDFEGF